MKKILLMALFPLLLSFFSFKTIDDSKIIIIGIAYYQKACGGASFSTVAGWRSIKGSGNAEASEERIREELNSQHSNKGIDIVIKSSSKPVAVILKYDKVITGWNCSVTKYVVGFGDNYQQAYDNALESKNNDDARATAGLVSTIYN